MGKLHKSNMYTLLLMTFCEDDSQYIHNTETMAILFVLNCIDMLWRLPISS